ncbi:MAG: Zn-dependent hydrolase, partial [Maritimibacter sp.]|nr:Zn-dependent hydrolase [Maritimibacter sp.]
GFGLDPDAISGLARDPATVLGYVETHIEQGPVLEAAGDPLGVVTAICGIERHPVAFRGETGHAGTLPMEMRRDALVGAAALITEVDRLAQATPGLLGTIGTLVLTPGAVNAVPREARLTVELRAPEDAVREAAGAAL